MSYVNAASDVSLGVLIPLAGAAAEMGRALLSKTQAPLASVQRVVSLAGLVCVALAGLVLVIGGATESITGSAPVDLGARLRREETLTKLTFAFLPLATLALCALRLTILSLYRQAFSSAAFQRTNGVVAVLIFLVGLAFAVGYLASCGESVSAFFSTQLERQAHCSGMFSLLAGFGLTDVILDGILIVIPVYPSWVLGFSVTQAYFVATAFAISVFGIVAGGIRTALSFQLATAGTDDPLSVLATIVWWFFFEVGALLLVAQILSCLSVFHPQPRQRDVETVSTASEKDHWRTPLSRQMTWESAETVATFQNVKPTPPMKGREWPRASNQSWINEKFIVPPQDQDGSAGRQVQFASVVDAGDARGRFRPPVYSIRGGMRPSRPALPVRAQTETATYSPGHVRGRLPPMLPPLPPMRSLTDPALFTASVPRHYSPQSLGQSVARSPTAHSSPQMLSASPAPIYDSPQMLPSSTFGTPKSIHSGLLDPSPMETSPSAAFAMPPSSQRPRQRPQQTVGSYLQEKRRQRGQTLPVRQGPEQGRRLGAKYSPPNLQGQFRGRNAPPASLLHSLPEVEVDERQRNSMDRFFTGDFLAVETVTTRDWAAAGLDFSPLMIPQADKSEREDWPLGQSAPLTVKEKASADALTPVRSPGHQTTSPLSEMASPTTPGFLSPETARAVAMQRVHFAASESQGARVTFSPPAEASSHQPTPSAETLQFFYDPGQDAPAGGSPSSGESAVARSFSTRSSDTFPLGNVRRARVESLPALSSSPSSAGSSMAAVQEEDESEAAPTPQAIHQHAQSLGSIKLPALRTAPSSYRSSAIRSSQSSDALRPASLTATDPSPRPKTSIIFQYFQKHRRTLSSESASTASTVVPLPRRSSLRPRRASSQTSTRPLSSSSSSSSTATPNISAFPSPPQAAASRFPDIPVVHIQQATPPRPCSNEFPTTPLGISNISAIEEAEIVPLEIDKRGAAPAAEQRGRSESTTSPPALSHSRSASADGVFSPKTPPTTRHKRSASSESGGVFGQEFELIESFKTDEQVFDEVRRRWREEDGKVRLAVAKAEVMRVSLGPLSPLCIEFGDM